MVGSKLRKGLVSACMIAHEAAACKNKDKT